MRLLLPLAGVCAALLLLGQGQDVFVDVASKAGLNDVLYCGGTKTKNYIIETLGSGAAAIDYDNDGWPDIFLVNSSTLEGFPAGQEPANHLYRNNHDGTFADVTKATGLVRSGWGQGVCAGDIDNDGFTDLYVTYYGHDVLYRNTGKGTFEDVTGAAGLAANEIRWETGCAFLDYNRDGKLDLFVSNYVQFDKEHTPTPDKPNACKWKDQPVMCGPRGLRGALNHLYRNDSTPGRIKFTDVSEASKITAPGERYALSVTTLDYDHDGWPDIYVAVDSQASILYRNKGDGTFQDTGVESGVAYSEDGREQAGMGTSAADYDGDGLLDLAKTNFIEDTPNIYRNNGDGSFTDATVPVGLGRSTRFLGWGVAFIDYDNDGWPDVLMVNGHVYPDVRDAGFTMRRLLYRNLGNGRFADVSQTSGAAITAQFSSRGLATLDYDNDGRTDVVITNMNDRPSLLHNTGGTGNHWVSLLLTGTKSNRSAIGARVTVVAGGRNLVNEVRSGSTFMSQSDLRLPFGLGKTAAIDRVEIEWPGGAKQTVTGVKIDHFVSVTEGKGVTAARPPETRK